MLQILAWVLLITLAPRLSSAIQWHENYVGYNLNENKTATQPRDYWGEWEGHEYTASPDNWRMPFYVLTIDRFLDGDPTNNEANGTVFEHNWMSNQFRFGGDVVGAMNDLDYIQGLGIKVSWMASVETKLTDLRAIYITGTAFINMPWASDGYGPLDFTLLDRHHGNILEWRNFIDEVHSRGMYVIFDNTISTMGDLIGFGGSLNQTTPFSFDEYDPVWKSGRRYHDFLPSAERDPDCKMPRMWAQNGLPLNHTITSQWHGCRDSEFDHYGEIKGTGAYETYVNQLSKFAGVQDRLREWRPSVLEKIMRMSCMQIAMLDIDGFRVDKAIQVTIDALAEWGDYQRQCARRFNKENFLIVGELVGDPKAAAVYFGRGKEPDQYLSTSTEAVTTSNNTSDDQYVREFGLTGLDGAAFHYDVYGSLTRLLGLDGPWGSQGVDWVNFWNRFLREQDLVNVNTGKFDPRHLFGTTNQDVFRWPALANGTQRQLLGFMITMLELPGAPMVYFGEEQEYYILENLAPDYVFGRMPMGSARAWQLHGCYGLGEEVYVDMPFDKSGRGCHDDKISLDHRDPSHPMRNILKRIFEIRRQYPVLNDGFNLTTLSTQTYDIYLRGSGGLPSPHGIWSVYRGRSEHVQDFDGIGQGNQGAWLVFTNENRSTSFDFNCSSSNTSEALIAPFPVGTTVRNLFYPYEKYTLDAASSQTYGIEGSQEPNGCLASISLRPWDWKVFVPIDNWAAPGPSITEFLPGHDARLVSSSADGHDDVDIELYFNQPMDCDSVRDSISITSTTGLDEPPVMDPESIKCLTIEENPPFLVSQPANAWRFKASLTNVAAGIHRITVSNATNAEKNLTTGTKDHFMFRIGREDNPIVFPERANYTENLLHRNQLGLFIEHRAPGADKFRYSLNWGSSWSRWYDYNGANFTLNEQNWTGTRAQRWEGDHVIVNYWSKLAGSSEHIQHGDLNRGNLPARRWPHAFAMGRFNQYGYDGGLPNKFHLTDDGMWEFDLVTEWPSDMIINVWGMNLDGVPDKSAAYGDVDMDGVLDWVPPDSLAQNVLNMTRPPRRHLGLRTIVNDGNFSYRLVPIGSLAFQVVAALLLLLVPLITAIGGVYAFMGSFYQVKFNKIGVTEKKNHLAFLRSRKADNALRDAVADMFNANQDGADARSITSFESRRRVLIATIEYEIEDWNIKVKIGGLGVMASLMGKNLGHQDLIWVVPCTGDIDYPVDETAEPMTVKILGVSYEVQIQYHRVANITFVLLDAPVFRKQTKADPYPARMDDLESAIYYSAWNQCIAEAINRFDVDIYHINDYHGALAPYYLLPSVIPCCLSLHNAEFQGLWSLRTDQEKSEICLVFNLENDVVDRYIQFGEVFNLLHAGASYLRSFQKGFGAVGVSKKYGKRSLMRYPIFWGLEKIGSLPNPDPSDTAPLDKDGSGPGEIQVDPELERNRGLLRTQAQEWAGLKVDPEAELFVFVGRWSLQKGIDLIADIFFSVLEDNPRTQLICVGPVIDLYGKFAALKLKKMMEKYPGRVFSKPEFTVLPPFVFSGAEFALIPSRDEPFGLVAVEFGRKGALGVGARVGGLGQMPGWWYTVESTTTKHLLSQFKTAVKSALATKREKRAVMRARSLVQRFPVAQWLQDLEILQSESIRISHQQQMNPSGSILRSLTPTIGNRTPTSRPGTRSSSPMRRMGREREPPRAFSPADGLFNSSYSSGTVTPHGSFAGALPDVPIDSQQFGPGHAPRTGRRRLSKTNRTSSRSSSIDSTVGRHRNRSRSQSRSRLDPLTESRFSLAASKNESSDSVPEMPIGNQWPLPSFGSTTNSAAGSSRSLSAAPPFSPAVDLSQVSIRQSFLQNPWETAQKSLKRLSLNTIVNDKKDYKLQNVDPFFTDSQDVYYQAFEKMLEKANAKNSEGYLCIEQFLTQSEKHWFVDFHRAKLGMSVRSSTPGTPHRPGSSTATNSVLNLKLPWSAKQTELGNEAGRIEEDLPEKEQFVLPDDYIAPTGLKKLLQKKVGDWQVYCILLAIGQIMAANSYQITLLTGQLGQTTTKLYVLAAIYIAATCAWWILYRKVQAVYILSTPFALYGLAFFLLGMGVWTPNKEGREWVYNISTALYAIASASGSMFFTLNFGTEGGTATKSWAFRACVIQGTQQVYIAFLWYWGASLTNMSSMGSKIAASGIITAITTPISLVLFAIAIVLYLGLPAYYRMKPGRVPSFYTSLLRRKVVLCFFVMVILQNYFLSTPYNRNWRYLWSSQHTPFYSIAILVLVFFVGVWGLLLFVLARLSTSHSWIIPIFAISLGAPRWCQMLWSTSNIGMYTPWVWHSDIAGALLGRCLWLWLGVLDAVQGVGFGMILLQTLTRFHVAFVLMAAQAIGAITTVVARASAPNRLGPGTVFPDFSIEGIKGLAHAWFWIALIAQLVVCAGFFKVFRKEQLFKP